MNVSQSTLKAMYNEWRSPVPTSEEDTLRMARAIIQPFDESWRHVIGGIQIVNIETGDVSFMPQAVYDAEIGTAIRRIEGE